MYVHGVNYYYNNLNNDFNEMIANYAVLLKSKNFSQMLGWLRYIVDMFNNFYREQILKVKVEKKESENKL